jgi:hypothetical protein
MNEETLQAALSQSGLSALQKALILIWYDQSYGIGAGLTPYEISKWLIELRVGNPNRERLEKELQRSEWAIKNGKKFRLRAGKSKEIEKWISARSDEPVVDLSNAFISEQVWGKTRGYIEKVAIQLCGCWEHNYLDAASVMLRRLVETMIIEAYEHLQRQSEIQDSDGNYYMLSDLIERCSGVPGIGLGREAKTALKDIKRIGDRSAHNRRINAVKHDLEQVRAGARVALEELIHIANLRRA